MRFGFKQRAEIYRDCQALNTFKQFIQHSSWSQHIYYDDYAQNPIGWCAE